MPLPLPNLDTRRWADLVEEGRALIPRYAPNWTDHNIHDPGITLIELFAWLVESDIYRTNQIPERHRRKFLALVGFHPLPPRPSQGVLSFTPEAATPSFLIPAGAEFEAVGSDNTSTPFCTTRDINVSVVELSVLQVDTGDGIIINRTSDRRDNLAILPFGPAPSPGAALYLGFAVLPVETPVALAFFTGTPEGGSAERARIVAEAAAQREACRHVLPDFACAESDQLPEMLNPPPHHSARVIWECFTGGSPEEWTRLEVVEGFARPDIGQVMDDTRSLTLDGIVEINLPANIAKTDLGNVGDESLFYLRCRLERGSYDASPQLADITTNGVIIEQAVPVWQRFKIAASVTVVGTEPTPGATTRLNMTLNAGGTITALEFFDEAGAPDNPEVMILAYDGPDGTKEGQITIRVALAGTGNGRPEQRLTLPRAPVQVEGLRLFTQSGGIWKQWTGRDDLDGSGRTDFHFVLDAMSGEIRGGDGERGRVFPPGALILVDYRWTRGKAGNLSASRVIHTPDSPRNRLWFAGLPDSIKDQLPHIISNPRGASGGEDEEDFSAMAGRAVAALHAHERLVSLSAERKVSTLDQIARAIVSELPAPSRAVNLLDIERVALDVPGTHIARVRALAATHPDYPCLESPGVVTVIVIPDLPVPRPEPSRGLLQSVKRFLDRRRILCTRIEVVGPHYLEVRVSARVQTLQRADRTRVKADIRQSLDAFFDPRSGGPNQLGWPFGRDVYRSEILQVIDTVPGVDHVLELSLSADAGNPQCDNLRVCPTWVVTPGEYQLEVI